MKNIVLSDFIKKKRVTGSNFLLFVTIGLFVVMYLFGMIIYGNKNFDRMQTFMNMLINNGGLLVAASGMTLVMITGGIDISVGSVVGLTCMIMAYSMERMGIPCGAAILIVLLFGIAFGALQGWLISYMELQPFIITLAGLFFCRGLTAVISSDTIAITNKFFLAMAKKDITLPFGAYINRKGDAIYPFIHPNVVIALVTVAIVWVILKYTRFGRNLFAIGGNEQSALLMGINVKKNKFFAYMLEGFLASLAGLLFCLNTCGGFVEQARGFEMDAIASAVIGGTMLTGGVGTVIGTFFGVLIKATIEALISFNGTLSSWWSRIVLSLILCFFIVLQSIFTIVKNRKKQ
ncbi:ABC transporter permease subunit [Treponema sp.]|uniref:ABC transporter permease subunit n=1 Tax=Treponema sp. TaxID=166 RepID=UPI00388E728A